MSLWDDLLALVIIVAILGFIVARLAQKYPKLAEWIKGLNIKKAIPEQPKNPPQDFRQQIHPERHTMM